MARYGRSYEDRIWYGGGGLDDGDSDVEFGYSAGGFGRGNHGGGSELRRGPRTSAVRGFAGGHPGGYRVPRVESDRPFGRGNRAPFRSGRLGGYDVGLRPLHSDEPLARELRREAEDLVTGYLREERYGDDYAQSMGLRTHGPGNPPRRLVRRVFRRGNDRYW